MRPTNWLQRFFFRTNSARIRAVCAATRRRERALAHSQCWLERLETRIMLTSDFGDAPDISTGTGTGDYQTLLANGGPSHVIDTTQTTLFLGARVDGEADATQSARANGDDITTLPDDEGGLIEPAQDLLLTIGTAPVVRARATNTTGSAATLYGWIDFNRDGVFDDATERTSVTVPTGASNLTFLLTFPTIPINTTAGATYARFRLSTDVAAANSTGSANGGEVEDYTATITRRSNSTVDGAKSVKIGSDTNGGPTLANGDFFGSSVASLGDLNGDGVTDLAVGAFLDDMGGPDRGALYVQFMNSDGTVKSSMKIANESNGGPVLANDDRFGSSVASLGDLNGDGVTDLAVGAYSDDTNGSSRGAVHVLLMSETGTVKSSVKIASGMNGGPTLANTDLFGVSVASLGDLDGDGVTDLVVGARGDDTGGTDRGAVYVMQLNRSGAVKSSVKIASGTNGSPTLMNGDNLGISVASLGDLDGDGVTDLAVGAHGNDTRGTDRGAVYVMLLNANGEVKSSVKLASSTNGVLPLVNGDFFGRSVASLGDLDGDGVSDLTVGAWGDDTGGTDRGAAYVLLLNASGTVKSSVKIANMINGGSTLADVDLFGGSVASLGDLDGDGVTDLAVGAVGDDTGGVSSNRGVLHVLLLKPSVNKAPTLANAIPDRNATEESAFTFAFATNTFADVDAGDSLTYSATRSDGTALPNWLKFTPTTRTFSGTPLNSDVGTLSIKVTATDTSGATATDTFNIVVAKSASVFNGGYTGSYRGTITDPRSISLESIIANRSFTATITDGDVIGNLPATGGTGTGTVDGEGNLEVSDSGPIFYRGVELFVKIDFRGRLVATTAGVTGSGTIDISGDLTGTGTWTATRTSTTPNKAPVFEIPASPDQKVLEDAGAQIANGFATGIADGDIDKIQTSKFLVTTNNDSLFLTKPLIDATTGTLAYAPAPNANGTATVTVKLKDNGGTARGGVDTSASKTFLISVTPINDGPTITAIADVTIDEDEATGAIAFKVDDLEDKLVNLNGVTITATSSNTDLVPNLPANIVLGGSAGSRTIKLVPLANQFGMTTMTVTATDSNGATTEETFVLTVRPINDAPRVVPVTFQLPEFTANNASVGTVAAVDLEGHAITSFAITGGNAGNAFKIDPITREIKVNDATKIDFESLATYKLMIMATDSLGAAGAKPSETGPVTINVTNQTFDFTLDLPEATPNSLTITKLGNTLLVPGLTLNVPEFVPVTPVRLDDFGTLTINGGSVADTLILDKSLNSAGSIKSILFKGTIVFNGGDGDDVLTSNTITVSTFNVVFDGGAGNDTASAGAELNTLLGGDGNDLLTGGAGNDLLNGGAGDDALTGGKGNDTYRFTDAGTAETDTVKELSNEGLDLLDFGELRTAVAINLNSETALATHANRTVKTAATGATKLAPNFENGTGGAADDSILGNAVANSLSGGAGRDTIIGGAGNDTLRGGNDDDTVIGGQGADSLSGDGGSDFGLGGKGGAVRGGSSKKDTGDLLDAGSIEEINEAFATVFAFEL